MMTLSKSIFIQATSLVLIALSCLAIGFGSWLETNNLLYSSSPSISRQLSVFKLDLVSRANQANAIYLSFGLWRYCALNTVNNLNACSPIQMNFGIGKHDTHETHVCLQLNETN